jgi:hypothetical protein
MVALKRASVLCYTHVARLVVLTIIPEVNFFLLFIFYVFSFVIRCIVSYVFSAVCNWPYCRCARTLIKKK